MSVVASSIVVVLTVVGEAPIDPAPCGGPVEGMVCLPGGEMIRGRDRGPKEEGPATKVTIDPFYMDTTEVTASAFEACKAAGVCRKKAGPNYKGYSDPKQPIVGIMWLDAEQYCAWRNKRLPTEAEWEFAARGHDGRLYPWGDAPATCDNAVINDSGTMDKTKNGCGRGKTWDVGTRPATLWGLYDIVGNSWEYVADWYTPSLTACGKACSGHNPKGPCPGQRTCPGHEFKMVKGGSWYWDATHATTTRRRPQRPDNKPYHHFGFRCAKDASNAAPQAPGAE
jgi:formylglycine-generating enzyme required for sulfatase activity